MRARWKVGVAAVSAGALLAAITGCTATATTDPDAPTVIRIGVSPDQLADHYSVNLQLMYALNQKATFDPLFLENQDTFALDPSMATGMERSDDWKVITISLREGITFHDGTAFNAENLVTYWNGLADLETWSLKAISEPYGPTYAAVDEYTVTITAVKGMDTLSRGFARQILNTVPIASPATFDDLQSDGTFKDTLLTPLGSGAYTSSDLIPGVSVTLTKNPDYWNPDKYPFETMELYVYADDVAALNALQAGQIDTTRLTVQLADQAKSQGFNLSEGNGRFTAMFSADWIGAVQAPIGDVRVRQAMAYAFDREAINTQFNLGYGTVTSCPFQAPSEEYVAGCENAYGYDPDKARELLADAGYADGFHLDMPSTAFLDINQWEPVIEQYLGDIGITVDFTTYETGDYFGSIIGPNNPVFFYSEVFVQALAVFIPESVILNSYDFEDPYVEERWLTMQVGPDAAATTAAQELGKYVIDQALLVPFAAAHYVWAFADGFDIHVGNSGENMLTGNFQLAG
jgi:peptide/nickel transport system substrate-binding protein